MAQITLIGSQHDVKNRRTHRTNLMGRYSERLFVERVLPRITNDSLLFSEGSNHGLLKPGDRGYESSLAEAFPSVAASGKKPKLASADPRWSPDRKTTMAIVQMHWELIPVYQRCIILDKEPVTLEEMLEMIRSRDTPHSLKRQPSVKESDQARRAHRFNTKFIGNYVSMMREHEAGCDHMILVAGAAHSIALHVETSWPLDLFVESLDDPRWIHELYRGYLDFHDFAETLAKANGR